MTELYTPRATWSRVVAAAQGANILIYLGHGNGWPSPYAPYQGVTKNGLGLNPYSGSGTGSPVKYYGEDRIASQIRLAPGAVVLLNHLCYASGNGEPGSSEPSWDTARKRVDNYAAGFLKARAAAVLADAHSSLGNELAYLFGKARSILGAWRADSGYHDHERTFDSTRSPGFRVHVDPDTTKTGFYRSLVTKASVSTARIRVSAFRGTTSSAAVLRDAPTTSGDVVTKTADGARLWVTSALRTDRDGRTWAPVITTTGRRGYVAAWLVGFRGSAVTRTDVILRSRPRTTSAKLGTVRDGTRVTVTGSTRDSRNRVWLSVRTASGKTGWMAAWLMRP